MCESQLCLRVVLLSLALLGSSCANPAIVELRVRAAHDLECPQSELTERRLSRKGWEVNGCDQSATYLLIGSPKQRHWERDYTESGQLPPRRRASVVPPLPPPPPEAVVVVQEGGILVLNLRFLSTNLVVQLRAQPSKVPDLVAVRLYKKAPPILLEGCELKLVADGEAVPTPTAQYESKSFSEQLTVSMPFASLEGLANAQRVLGQACETRFVLGQVELSSLRKFVVQFKEELALGNAGSR